MIDIIKDDSLFVASTYARFPVALVSGKGATYYSDTNKEYIDMGSGIGVTAFGACDDEWKTAVINQLNKLAHTSNLYYTEPCVTLAKMLAQKTGLKKTFFSNSGAEANECAIKVARKYYEDKYGKQGYIITLKNSFHGRTLATLSATGQDKFHELFNPLVSNFLHADANDLSQIENLIKSYPVCAVMIEIVQGEGGVNALDKTYVQGLDALCKSNDILLIVDEVQTGNGRTGELYAYQAFNIMPDVVTTAKGLGGGLPIGACMMGEKVENVLTFGSHGSTFGGNPVACAGAVSIISRLNPEFLSEVKKKGDYIVSELKNLDGVESVSGLGLMLGIKTKKPIKEVVNYCIENGVLVLTAKDKLRLLPPLNITFSELEKAIKVIKEAIKL
ncbi:MAG: aspartate aminotransferase family protein [Clostridiales bacterium]|nr:aspartate aminotransferase family protein [Clostridiales bacterium]